MSYRPFRNIGRCLFVVSALSLGVASLNAQRMPNITAPSGDTLPRYNIFLGYSYFNAHGQVEPFNLPYTSIPAGGIVSGAYFFTHHVGAEASFVLHHGTGDNGSNNDGFDSLSVGPIVRFPVQNFTPFVHALFGAGAIVGPNNDGAQFEHEPWTWGPAYTVGGGLDYDTPLWGRRISVRVIQADFRYSHADFGTPYTGSIPDFQTAFLGGTVGLKGVDLSAGVVIHPSGESWKAVMTYGCEVTVPTGPIYPGDIVTITGTAGQMNPKKDANYTWSAQGFPVSGTSDVVSVNTQALAPGTYTVRGHVSQGNKPYEMADCTTQFTIRNFDPPTVSCSANPSNVNPGESSTITANGVSPQNRPLHYSYSATAGTVSGNTSTATLATDGAAPGSTITVTCDVVDDRRQTASQTASVMIAAPAPPPPAATASSLCSISFSRDARRPTRVDNEAKACLDDIALSVQRDPQSKLAVVGNAADGENMGDHKAAERSVNEKAYLVGEKGIDASRISVYTGTDDARSATTTLIPAGASFDSSGLNAVDEGSVRPTPREPLPAARHRRK
jgi:hypothetical protein